MGANAVLPDGYPGADDQPRPSSRPVGGREFQVAYEVSEQDLRSSLLPERAQFSRIEHGYRLVDVPFADLLQRNSSGKKADRNEKSPLPRVELIIIATRAKNLVTCPCGNY